MAFFAGLNVSIDETAICIVGDDAKVAFETALETDPAMIAARGRVSEALDRLAADCKVGASIADWAARRGQVFASTDGSTGSSAHV